MKNKIIAAVLASIMLMGTACSKSDETKASENSSAASSSAATAQSEKGATDASTPDSEEDSGPAVEVSKSEYWTDYPLTSSFELKYSDDGSELIDYSSTPVGSSIYVRQLPGFSFAGDKVVDWDETKKGTNDLILTPDEHYEKFNVITGLVNGDVKLQIRLGKGNREMFVNGEQAQPVDGQTFKAKNKYEHQIYGDTNYNTATFIIFLDDKNMVEFVFTHKDQNAKLNYKDYLDLLDIVTVKDGTKVKVVD